MTPHHPFNAETRLFCQRIAKLAFCNPFLPERMQLEQELLGPNYRDHGTVWHAGKITIGNPNIEKIQGLATQKAQQLRQSLIEGATFNKQEAQLYRSLVLYLLYQRYEPQFQALVLEDRGTKVIWYRAFLRDFEFFLSTTQLEEPELPPPVLFACYFQVRRAFQQIFNYIIGGSMAAAKLRARIWQSIFTYDMNRYRHGLYERMGDITTLITGPSGTGKELVARAVGMARFIPFDAANLRFDTQYQRSFFALNLSALSPTLLESELFGHRRGAFTGALTDRAGWLETCPDLGTVFLDEIGELDTAFQVKLLRVLQARTFQRLGETETRHFAGKVVAATNRNLGQEMESGNFRQDLYYRLCADQITTPSLASQLEGSEDELHHLVRHIAHGVAGSTLGPQLAEESVTWIKKNLPPQYAWPGNFRELEQCVRNILIGGSYRPRVVETNQNDVWDLAKANQLSAERLLSAYCLQVYQHCGSYIGTAKITGLDRRTVKAKVEQALAFKKGSPAS